MPSCRGATRFQACSAATIAVSLLALAHAACATQQRAQPTAGAAAAGTAGAPAASLALAATATTTAEPSTATIPAHLLTVSPPRITVSVPAVSASVFVLSPNPTAHVTFGTNPPALSQTPTATLPPFPVPPCESDYILYQPPATPYPLETPPGLVGQPNVKILATTPRPTSTTQPVLHGPFRLVVDNYSLPLHIERLHCPAVPLPGRFVNTQDPAVVRQSSLYRQPTYLPAGYQLTSLGGGGFGNAEQTVSLLFQGPAEAITIEVWRLTVLPVDYWIPSDTSYPFVVQQGQVSDAPAIIDHQAFPLGDSVSIRFVFGEALDVLEGEARTLQEVPGLIQQLTQLAESLR